MTTTCPTCEKIFPRLIKCGRNPRYCSEACRREMNNRLRRLKRGSVPRSGRPVKTTPKKPAARAKDRASCTWSPDEWASWVRARYELDATEDVLLSLALDALKLSRDEGEARVRISAAGRFQSLLRQLGLESAEEEDSRDGKSEKDFVRVTAGRG